MMTFSESGLSHLGKRYHVLQFFNFLRANLDFLIMFHFTFVYKFFLLFVFKPF